MAARYLYGIIRDPGAASFGPIGLADGQQEVYTISEGGIAGVVSDYHGPAFHQLPREELLRRLVIHQRAIERVMQHHTILPAKFGTLLPSPVELRKALRCGIRPLSSALERFNGLVQYEVAATWEVGPVFDEIAREEPIAGLRAAAPGMSPAESLGLRISVGAMIKESLDRRREGIQSRLTSLLASRAVDHQANALMGDEMVLNVAFLVDRSAQEVFLAGLHEADELFVRKLSLRCIGPLPPYTFGTIEIVRPEPAEIDTALQLLDLGRRVSATAVRKAYREQAARLHPDANPSPEATERFARLRDAESLLVAYCSGRATGNGSWEDGVCHVTPQEVKGVYLVAVKRSGIEA